MPLIETRGALTSRAYGEFSAPSVVPSYIEDVFSTYLYTGNGTTQTITNGIDLSTKGGLLWIKARSTASGHNLYDTARGASKVIFSNQTFGDGTNLAGKAVTSFNANGFSLGPNDYSLPNNNGDTYVSWTFRKQAKFFDIVTYTGNGSGLRFINHSLGSAPGLVIIKTLNNTSNWPVMFAPPSGNAYGFSNGLSGGGLNSTAEGYSLGSVSNVVTATQFRVGSNVFGVGSETNDSGSTYIAYVFASNAGGFGASGTENAITCGSYVGNGSTTGPVINLGYEPQWLLIKNRQTGTTDDWIIVDTMRGLPVNGPANRLYPNNANSEASTNPYINISATGFQPVVTSSQVNTSGSNYIYMAIRRGPMRTPTSGTSVFSPNTYNGSPPPLTVTTGFPVDAVLFGLRNVVFSKYLVDRLRGSTTSATQLLATDLTDAELAYSGAGIGLDNNTGFIDSGLVASSYSAIYWAFRRAPGFFDEVCYTGTGANLTVSHNLGAAPQMMWVKTRTGNFLWGVYDSFNGATKFMRLNGTNASTAAANYFNNTSPTSSVFTVGTALSTVSQNYVAYLFGSVSGVSKFGNYTGTGSAQTISCDFTGGARFVLIKRTDTNGDWYVWDTARGISAGNDPYLLLNSTDAEVTGTDYISVQSSGFGLTATAPAGLNANGGSYIFFAIA
jgi:hypothetical protein